MEDQKHSTKKTKNTKNTKMTKDIKSHSVGPNDTDKLREKTTRSIYRVQTIPNEKRKRTKNAKQTLAINVDREGNDSKNEQIVNQQKRAHKIGHKLVFTPNTNTHFGQTKGHKKGYHKEPIGGAPRGCRLGALSRLKNGSASQQRERNGVPQRDNSPESTPYGAHTVAHRVHTELTKSSSEAQNKTPNTAIFQMFNISYFESTNKSAWRQMVNSKLMEGFKSLEFQEGFENNKGSMSTHEGSKWGSNGQI